MVLRDEQDIIRQNLQHTLLWADAVYILDLGSTDGTWDLVQQLAREDQRIVPFKRVPWIFNDNFRGILFDQYRDRFETGDWVLRLDADEFYHISPPDFVRGHIGRFDTAVWLQWYYFRITRGEVSDYESEKVSILQDRTRPISDRRRFYKISEYAEPRLFRYRRSMQWPETASFPINAGFVAPHRIPIRHYPHRDPLQMQARFRLRAKMMSLNAHAGGHWKLDDWRAEIVDQQGASESAKTKRGLSGEAGIDTGALNYWEPGTNLPQRPLPMVFDSTLRRATQRLIHPLLLPLLDRRRARFNRAYEPGLIPAEIQESLERDALAASG